MSYGANNPSGVPLGLPSIVSLGLAPLVNPYPALDLDFINNQTLDSRVTFSRGSQATLFDSTGTLVYAKHNLVLQSQDFATTWLSNNITVSANSVAAPDGTTTADTVTGNAGTALKRATQGATATSGSFTFSVFAKANTHNFIQLFYSGTGATTYANFDVSTGTAGNVSGTSSITAVGNGWYRCVHTFTANANTAVNISLIDSNTAARGDTTTTTNSVYLWGAQLNANPMEDGVTSSLTTYYPTTTAAYYAPRFDYNPSTLQPLGLLIEEARTNIVTFSNGTYANGGAGGWTNTSSTVATITAPDGTNTAESWTFSTGGTQNIYKVFSCTASTAYTWSFYYKLGTLPSSNFRIAIRDDSSGAFIASDVVPTSTAIKDGWVRATYSFTTPVGCILVRPYLYRFATVTGGSIAFWGAQLEAGAFATSVIPTTTTALTRNADVASMTGTNFSSWYSASEGTFVTNFLCGNLSTIGTVFEVGDGGLNNRMNTETQPATSLRAWPRVTVSGSLQIDIPINNVLSLTTATRTALAYATNNINFAANGTAGTTDTTCLVPTVDRMGIGCLNTTGVYLNGTIRRLAFYPQRLPNTTLQALTA